MLKEKDDCSSLKKQKVKCTMSGTLQFTVNPVQIYDSYTTDANVW